MKEANLCLHNSIVHHASQNVDVRLAVILKIFVQEDYYAYKTQAFPVVTNL